jgi:hypothetical protein
MGSSGALARTVLRQAGKRGWEEGPGKLASSALVCQGNRGRHAGHVPDHTGSVAFASQIFRQGHMARAKAMHRAIAQADFYLARQVDDVLPPWGIVPVRKTARLRSTKDNVGGGMRRCQLGVRGGIKFFDMRLPVRTRIQPDNAHGYALQ